MSSMAVEMIGRSRTIVMLWMIVYIEIRFVVNMLVLGDGYKVDGRMGIHKQGRMKPLSVFVQSQFSF
jgi:hypothetical protein